MENQQLVKSQVNQSTRLLLNIIHKGIKSGGKGILAVTRNHCEDLKINGDINFKAVLSIPSKDRMPGLVQIYGFKSVHVIVTALVRSFSDSYNLVRPMDNSQIVDCAATIVNSAIEDYLSIEDLVLFFDNAKRGIYGRVLDHMDEPLILEMLETYRQIRHTNYIKIKDSEHSQLKGMGTAERQQNDELAAKFYDLVGRIGYMRQELKDK